MAGESEEKGLQMTEAGQGPLEVTFAGWHYGERKVSNQT